MKNYLTTLVILVILLMLMGVIYYRKTETKPDQEIKQSESKDTTDTSWPVNPGFDPKG